MRIARFVCIGVAAVIPTGLWSRQDNSAPTLSVMSEADVAAGATLYRDHCSSCHGIDGSGGMGSNLRRATYKRAGDDDALVILISAGVPEAGMPESWMMSAVEIRQVAAFLRSIGRRAADPLPGDAVRGRAVYEKYGCSSCHIVDGQGGSLGPELSEIGWSRGAAHLRQSIVDPGADLPEKGDFIEAVFADGRKLEGAKVNEDVFNIQIRDGANNFHSINKREVGELRRPEGRSLMPAYDIRGKEMEDLVAYLAGLRGDE